MNSWISSVGAVVCAWALGSGVGVAAQEASAQESPPAPQASPKGPVSSVGDHRGEMEVDVVRRDEWIDLDLTGVNLDADEIIKVDGQPITQQELRRSLCLLVGSNEIDQYITFLLGQKVKKSLGANAAEISEAEVQKAFEDQKALATQMGQDGEAWGKQVVDEFGWDRYVEFQKIQLGFERLFLPDPPEGFMAKQNALFEEQKGPWEEAYAKWKVAYDAARQEAARNGTNPDEIDMPAPMPPTPEADLAFIPAMTLELLDEDFAKVLRENYARGQEIHPWIKRGVVSTLKRNLLEKSDVIFASEAAGAHLATDVLFAVDGETVQTDTVYALFRPRIDDATRRLALRELIHLRAVDRVLAAAGHLIDGATLTERYDAMREQYANSLIPLQQAILLRGFPNEYHYRRYYLRKSSYTDLVRSKTSEEQLRAHFDGAGRLFYEHGAGRGHVLFIPAEDRESGMEKMNAALAELAEGADFRTVAMEYGAYPATRQTKGGEFAGLVRNRLRQFLQESEFTTFATGYSLADEAFYRAVEGEVVGPVFRDHAPKMRGMFAVKMDGFTRTAERRSFDEAKESVLEDLSDLTFARFINDAVAGSVIEIPEPAGGDDGAGE